MRLLEVAEHRIVEDDIAVAGYIARVVAGRLASREVDQPSGIAHRQRPQQQLVEHGVNRGVRSDAERERQDGNERNERRLEERPERELEVSHGASSLRYS